jgi:hypothetical protein
MFLYFVLLVLVLTSVDDFINALFQLLVV